MENFNSLPPATLINIHTHCLYSCCKPDFSYIFPNVRVLETYDAVKNAVVSTKWSIAMVPLNFTVDSDAYRVASVKARAGVDANNVDTSPIYPSTFNIENCGQDTYYRADGRFHLDKSYASDCYPLTMTVTIWAPKRFSTDFLSEQVQTFNESGVMVSYEEQNEVCGENAVAEELTMFLKFITGQDLIYATRFVFYFYPITGGGN